MELAKTSFLNTESLSVDFWGPLKFLYRNPKFPINMLYEILISFVLV